MMRKGLRSTFIIIASLFATHSINAQQMHEIDKIKSVLLDYIEGTANSEPDRLRNAFHPDFNLYTVNDEGKLWIRSGEQYIAGFTPGKKLNRVGRIISIDYENNVAMAKAEIVVPNYKTFIDYFMLVKYDEQWRIVQKAYTAKE